MVCLDWDHDGDLDVWTTNRNAPTVRYQENNIKDAQGDFIALHLTGTGRSSRDAIGARVHATYREGEKEVVLVRSIRAGDSFLSQSSKWLHFGVPAEHQKVKLEIHWPDGKAQNIGSLALGKRYAVVQGQEPREVDLLKVPSTEAESMPDVEAGAESRIVLSNKPLLPPVHYRGLDGGKTSSLSDISSPTVLIFWASWCPNCARELNAFQKKSDALKALGVSVLAINIDESDQEVEARAAVEKWGLDCEIGLMSQGEVAVMDFFQRELFSVQTPLALPSAFFVDGSGRAVVNYRGTDPSENLADDMQLLSGSDEDLLRAAQPFSGRWLRAPQGEDPLPFVSRLEDEGLFGRAAEVLERYIRANDRSEKRIRPPRPRKDALRKWLGLAKQAKDLDEELNALRVGVEVFPNDVQLVRRLSRTLLSRQKYSELTKLLEDVMLRHDRDAQLHNHLIMSHLVSKNLKGALKAADRGRELNLKEPSVLYAVALCYQQNGLQEEAVLQYRELLEIDPENELACQNLAWILSTSSDESLKDGREAEQLVKSVLNKRSPNYLLHVRSLAAAHAEQGKYELSRKLLTDALGEFPSSPLAKRLKADLKLYKSWKSNNGGL